MKSNGNKTGPVKRSWRPRGIVFVVLVLTISVLVGIYWRTIWSIAKFFYMMEQLPSPTEVTQESAVEGYPLDEMKHIALFLLDQSDQDRRCTITLYNAYAQRKSDFVAPSLKLYLLLRLLFDVSEAYPANESRFFGGWIGLDVSPQSETIDLLWPLGYDDEHRLILRGMPWGYMGVTYDGLGEYDFFASRFPLRSVESLK